MTTATRQNALERGVSLPGWPPVKSRHVNYRRVLGPDGIVGRQLLISELGGQTCEGPAVVGVALFR